MSKPHSPDILCGTDFSPRAAEAAEVAAALATRRGAALTLVHAIDHGDADVADDRLAGEAARLRQREPQLQVETRLESGLADEVMLQLTTPEPGAAASVPGLPGLIVVSSLGRRGVARWLIGSVAERIAQAAPVPVLVVRDATPWQAWLSGERRLRVVVAFDFSEASAAALRWVSELARLGPCDVVCAHITDASPRPEARLPAGASSGEDGAVRLEAMLRNDLGVRVRECDWPSGPPKLRLERGASKRAHVLARIATEERADLLVVGSRQLHGASLLWQESVSRGVLLHATMCVACVPGQPDTEPVGSGEHEVAPITELVGELEQHPFLRGMTGEHLRRIASITHEQAFAPGTLMLREGTPADKLYLLRNGLVALEIDVTGKGPVWLESLGAARSSGCRG